MVSCAYDRHGTLVVSSQVGSNNIGIERLAVEAGVSRGEVVCSLQVLERDLVNTILQNNPSNVIAAVILPCRNAEAMRRAKAKFEMENQTNRHVDPDNDRTIKN